MIPMRAVTGARLALRPLNLAPPAPLQPGRLIALRRQSSTASEDDIAAARKWLASFTPETIPQRICDVTFSRSSGAGGQNVNKVSSKATLKLPLPSLLPLLPTLLHPEIRSSRYYARASDALVIQSDDSRKQAENTRACFTKLADLIAAAGAKVVPGETSEAQKERVKGLEKAANSARLKQKKQHSSKKSSRRGGFND